MKWLKDIIKGLATITVTVLVVLTIQNKDNIYTKPESPPVLSRSLLFHRNPTADEVLEYQDAILKYIQYLEQHYVSVGLYYGGKKSLPIFKHRNDECRIYKHMFRSIVLPKPPDTSDDTDPEIIIRKLIDHIGDFKVRIDENNKYMGELKRYFEPCFVS